MRYGRNIHDPIDEADPDVQSAVRTETAAVLEDCRQTMAAFMDDLALPGPGLASDF